MLAGGGAWVCLRFNGVYFKDSVLLRMAGLFCQTYKAVQREVFAGILNGFEHWEDVILSLVLKSSQSGFCSQAGGSS